LTIRSASPIDRPALLEIWLRSVRATHAFLSEEEIQGLLPHVDAYLQNPATEFVVLENDAKIPMGFMGMAGPKIESLFLAPEFFRQGGGRRLVDYARARYDELTVDVNEQNEAACRFYAACGFVVESRSECDDAGRPYPILRLRSRHG
jgi:putative acetyltransferase